MMATGQQGTPQATVSNLTATTATLTWAAVSGATHYTVQRQGGDRAFEQNVASPTIALSGLHPATDYSFNIIPITATGSLSFIQATFTTAAGVNTPSPPNVFVTDVERTKVTLHATPGPVGAPPHNLQGGYKYTHPVTNAVVPLSGHVREGQSGIIDLEADITGLAAGTEYSVPVTVTSESPGSLTSAPATITFTTAPAAPADPAAAAADPAAQLQNVSIPEPGKAGVPNGTIRFTAQVVTSEATVTGVLYRPVRADGLGDGYNWQFAPLSGGNVQGEVAGLPGGTRFNLQIRLQTTTGAAPTVQTITESNPSSGPDIPLITGGPLAPDEVWVSGFGSFAADSAVISATYPFGSDLHVPLQTRQARGPFSYRLDDSGDRVEFGAGTAATETIAGLSPATSHKVGIRGESIHGPGSYGPETVAYFATRPAGIIAPSATPEAPTIDSVTPGDRRLTVAFTPGGAGDSPITHYEARVSATDDWRYAGTLSAFTIPGLANGVSYPVQVRAVSSIGPGAPSAAVDGTPRDESVVPPPAEKPLPTSTAAGSITWSGLLLGFPQAEVTGWDWELWDSAATSARILNGTAPGGSDTMIVTTSPTTDTAPYRLRTRARAHGGAGQWSPWSDYRRAVAPSAPGQAGQPVLAPGPGGLRVTIERPSDDGNLPGTGVDYEIREAQAGGQGGPSGQQSTVKGPFAVPGSDGMRTFSVTKLDPDNDEDLVAGRDYEVRDRQKNAQGAGAWSEWSTAQAPAAQRPARVGKPNAESDGAKIAVTWSAPADGGSPITGYRMQQRTNGTPGAWTSIGALNTRAKEIGLSGSLFDFPPVSPDTVDDTGVRVRLTADSADPTSDSYTSSTAPAPRAVIPGAPGLYFKGWRLGLVADRTMHIDFDSVATDRPDNAGQNLPADALANWEWALRHDGTGAVLGPFRFNTGPQATDPYAVQFAAEDLVDFESQLAHEDPCTFIIFDPRAARTSGTSFSTLTVGELQEFRVQASNANGNGSESEYSDAVTVDDVDQPLEIALGEYERQAVIKPPWTTTVSIVGPSAASDPIPVSVVAPEFAGRALTDLRVEVGTISARGDFAVSGAPLRYIASTLKFAVNAHTPAWCEVSVRADTAIGAQALIGNAALRVTAVAAGAVSTMWMGVIDPTRCSFHEEAHNKTWIARLAAVTLMKGADKKLLLQSGEYSDQTPADAAVRNRLLRGTLPGYYYSRKRRIEDHLTVRADELGPALLVDPRDWPDEELTIHSSFDSPVTYSAAAKICADALGDGWQMAPDGFMRPLLDENYPARIIDPTEGKFNLVVRGVSPAAGTQRDFALFGAPSSRAGEEVPVVARHVERDGGGDPVLDEEGRPKYDHADGAVTVIDPAADIVWRGQAARVHKLVILDPGGWGSRAPLPPMVDPVLARVGVVRFQSTGPVREITEYLLSDDGEVLQTPQPGPAVVVQPRVGRVSRSRTSPVARAWTVSPTHLIREGWINDDLSLAEGAGNTAQRAADTGWRFIVVAEVIERVRAPQEVSWDSLYPLQIGRKVDVSGIGGPVGGLRVVRMQARFMNDRPGDLKLVWRITATQSAELEEALDGYEFWRSAVKGSLARG